jgi:hypothetical protein
VRDKHFFYVVIILVPTLFFSLWSWQAGTVALILALLFCPVFAVSLVWELLLLIAWPWRKRREYVRRQRVIHKPTRDEVTL